MRLGTFIIPPIAALAIVISGLGYWENSFSKDTFILGDTVALGVTCDSHADPSEVEFQISNPIAVREVISGLTSCPSDNVLLSSFSDCYVWLKDRRQLFHKGYLHISERKIAFYAGARAAFYSIDERGLELLLAAKPDCSK